MPRTSNDKPRRSYRQKRRKRSPPVERAPHDDEEEGMSTCIEYTTGTDSESEDEQCIAHRRRRCCGLFICSQQRRKCYCDCLRDLALCALLLYWVVDIEAHKRKWLWYSDDWKAVAGGEAPRTSLFEV